jgi:hypothetical protein
MPTLKPLLGKNSETTSASTTFLKILMIVRNEEFLALKQGPLIVSEYRGKFLQLSRYAPEDVNTDAKRQYRFLRDLVDPLQYQLMNHTFPTFQHLID